MAGRKGSAGKPGCLSTLTSATRTHLPTCPWALLAKGSRAGQPGGTGPRGRLGLVSAEGGQAGAGGPRRLLGMSLMVSMCFYVSSFLKSSMKCPLQNKPPVKPHFLTLPATDGRGQAGCVGGKRCQGACRWSPHQSDRGPPGFRTLKRGTEKSHRQPVVGSYTLSTVHPEIPEHPLQRKGPPVSVADGLP